MMELTFSALQAATLQRLPHFKNRLGGKAHGKPDGSDWTPADWLLAMLGEVGEWAQLRIRYEAGDITREEYEREAPKELADIACYLAMLSSRALDVTTASPHATDSSAARRVMHVAAGLGAFCNALKKANRGDLNAQALRMHAVPALAGARCELGQLLEVADMLLSEIPDRVTTPHPYGVDLGRAVGLKFNEVSDRIGYAPRICY
jgi:hypothetical protein